MTVPSADNFFLDLGFVILQSKKQSLHVLILQVNFYSKAIYGIKKPQP